MRGGEKKASLHGASASSENPRPTTRRTASTCDTELCQVNGILQGQPDTGERQAPGGPSTVVSNANYVCRDWNTIWDGVEGNKNHHQEQEVLTCS